MAYAVITRDVEGGSAYAGALADRCRKGGLIVSNDDDSLTLFPALTISSSAVNEGLDILERCL
jgi:4-aminobutyrate aminotransferase-like enzyme